MLLPLRSKTSHASADAAAVHEICIGLPSALMSNITPFCAFVKLKPLPATSMTIGEMQRPPEHIAPISAQASSH
jgi:hypothetical protein